MKKGLLFRTVKAPRIKRNAFDLSHTLLTSCDMGKLVPVLCQEVVPGDTFSMNSSFFVRFQPLIAPVMHNINVYFHSFFVPTRLIWDDFEEFIGWSDSDTSERPVVPYFTYEDLFSAFGSLDAAKKGLGVNTLNDYFGLPLPASGSSRGSSYHICSLPLRAYHFIWNEYYRDENLQDEFEFSRASGREYFAPPEPANLMELFTLRNRCWEKDYFTSALPWLQKGDPVELLPNQEYSATTSISSSKSRFDVGLYNSNGTTFHPDQGEFLGVYPDSTDSDVFERGTLRSAKSIGQIINNTTRYVAEEDFGHLGDTETANKVQVDASELVDSLKADTRVSTIGTGITINALRRASKLQEWKELMLRGGNRFIEIILSHFGVVSDDARLQRPEYLGGMKVPVLMQEVLQTSETANSPQGNPAGKGVAGGRSSKWKRHFKEHGYVITIMSVMPQTSYEGGLSKMWTRFDNLDYYWPKFANLGEQEITKKELYFYANDIQNTEDVVFGYTPRYAEYKYVNDRFCGDFRDTLTFWHLGRFFSQSPNLNEDFVVCNPRTDIFSVQDDNYRNTAHLLFQIRHNIKAFRPMPKYGTPRLN